MRLFQVQCSPAVHQKADRVVQLRSKRSKAKRRCFSSQDKLAGCGGVGKSLNKNNLHSNGKSTILMVLTRKDWDSPWLC